MKIGIILHKIDPRYRGGLNSYIMNLLEGLRKTDKNNKYILFVGKKNRDFFKKRFEEKNFEIKEITPDKRKGLYLLLKNKLNRAIVDYFAILPVVRIFFPHIYKLAYRHLISLIDNSDIDIIYCPYELPMYFKQPSIVTIHDIQHIHYPEFFSRGQLLHRYTFYKETVRGAAVVQAASEYTRQDYINYFHIPSERVALIRSGVNEIFKKKINKIELARIKDKYKLPEKFIFYPAQHWRHKNHLNLIKAISFLRERYDLKIPLVFTGEMSREFQFLYRAINKSGLKENIRLLGNIPFNDLPFVYKLATITAVPSLHESSSLSVMEALSVGCPVAASNIEPHLELNINNAIVIFDAKCHKDIATKIKLLWDDETIRKEKIRLGQELAEEFSWEKTAENYILIFEKIHKGDSNRL